MNISDYLKSEGVEFFQAPDKESAITYLARRAGALGYISDKGDFLPTVLDRENIMSTGLGLGVAVPHAKLPDIQEFFVVFGVLKEALPWDSLDKLPVSLVILIGGPADRQNDYLRILSKITLVIKNPERRKALIKATTAAEVLTQFENL